MLSEDFDYYNPTPLDEGYIHRDDLPNLDHMRDHVRGIMNAFYGSGDVYKLEQSLDEVCHELEITVDTRVPVLARIRKGDADWHLGYQSCQNDNEQRKVK